MEMHLTSSEMSNIDDGIQSIHSNRSNKKIYMVCQELGGLDTEKNSSRVPWELLMAEGWKIGDVGGWRLFSETRIRV